ncbi:MAG: TIM barrel protein [Verrucomicrobia bacterium]|nr:TIM barrel protein [Verrucomicrobiota bacterium]MCF7707848.1 TIM barrel protein [Verrucomicrobiota bacterium]
MNNQISRRSAIRKMAGSAAFLGAAAMNASAVTIGELKPLKLKGNIRHSVSRWCYGGLSLDELCIAAKKIGIEGIDLLGENEWPVVKKHGLTCAMCNGAGGISHGFNKIENHDGLVEGYKRLIPKVAEAGFPNIICFSGNRDGMDDEEGMKNCVKGLKRIMSVAEKHKVNVVMELLNSKVNHKGYQCDHTAWGAEVVKGVGSERMKLLYDIYHMQIMEGDLVRTIRQFHQYIGHYHTGGNPGRHEIDETQEIYYPAVMRAIVDTGFKGFVAQEFTPTRDPLTSMRESIEICDV